MKQPKHFIIRGERQIKLVYEVLGMGPLDGSIEVVIKPYKKNRSYEQQKGYFVWLAYIGEHTGSTKEELHENYKRKFLIHILAEDDEAFYSLLQVIANGGTEDDRKRFVRELSTTKLNTKQFARYMSEIESHANSMGIALPELIR